MSPAKAPRMSDAIRSLLPPEGAGESAYLPAFRALADLLLNRSTLVVGGEPHRLTEVELYYHGPDHADDFAHKNPLQREIGLWYFHRFGEEYRSGTYKGLDVTFGRDGAYGGILIRGAARSSAPFDFIDGPSLLVDHVLRLTDSATIRDLVGKFDLRVDAPEAGGSSPLFMSVDDGPGRGAKLFASPRVGLTLKRGDLERKQRFVARPYRFLTEPSRTKKGRAQLIVALHREGMAPHEIARTTGSTVASVERYIALYEEGRAKKPAELRGDLSPQELCLLLGACHAFW
jgi:hypothetical protein